MLRGTTIILLDERRRLRKQHWLVVAAAAFIVVLAVLAQPVTALDYTDSGASGILGEGSALDALAEAEEAAAAAEETARMAAESATRQAEVLAAAAPGAGPGGAGGGAGAGAGGSNGTADAEETELVQDTAAVVDNEMVHRRGKYLALMGKRFPVDLAGGELTIHGTPIFIKEVANSGKGTGLTVWDASVVMAKYLEQSYPAQLVGRTVLELGAGTGIVGIVASVLGAKKVYLTDLPYTLDNLKECIKLNKAALKGEVVAEPLDWKEKPSDYDALDLIIASDVVWIKDLIEPLVQTIERLTERPKSQADNPRWVAPLVLLGHQTRSRDADKTLFGLLKEKFTVHETPYDSHHVEFRDDAIRIYQLQRRKE